MHKKNLGLSRASTYAFLLHTNQLNGAPGQNVNIVGKVNNQLHSYIYSRACPSQLQIGINAKGHSLNSCRTELGNKDIGTVMSSFL